MLDRRHNHQTAKRGVVLLITMWALIVLGLIALQVSVEVRRDIKITALQRDDFRARSLARAGIGQAVCDIKNDTIADNDPLRETQQPFDALTDIWRSKATLEEPHVLEFETYTGSFYYTVQDEESKLNINRSSRELLKSALMHLGRDEFDSELLACAIFDWRDANDGTNFMSAEARERADLSLAERELEAELIDPRTGQASYPENIVYGREMRNEDYMVLEELLDIPGITPELLYGRNPLIEQLPPNPFPVVYDSEQDLRDRRRSGRQPGLVDFFTAQPTKSLNLNTASLDALIILFDAMLLHQDYEQAVEMAEEILRERGDPDRRQRSEEAFTNLGDAARLPQLSQSNISRLTRLHPLGVQSNYFTIYAQGQANNSRAFFGAVVNRRMVRYQLAGPDGQVGGNNANWRDSSRSRDRAQQRSSRNRVGTPENVVEEPRVQCVMWMEW